MTIDELIAELNEEAKGTRRVLERVPADRLEWQPHEKSLTLGQLAMHVATIPGALAELSMQPSFDVRTEIPRPGVGSVSELLEALDRSVARAGALLSEMGDDGLTRPWRMVDGSRELMALPRGAFLRSVMLNHWYHHRGQLTVYLRLTGAPVPGIYGDSADERPFPI
ncbi:MAG TPA: DinB family protein [Gemmatimonadaceae bacterium]|nr:DinB family protein [Gemmatimonadaceae bacterium]